MTSDHKSQTVGDVRHNAHWPSIFISRSPTLVNLDRSLSALSSGRESVGRASTPKISHHSYIVHTYVCPRHQPRPSYTKAYTSNVLN